MLKGYKKVDTKLLDRSKMSSQTESENGVADRTAENTQKIETGRENQ